MKVTGWVIDSACAYTKGLDKPIGVACAKACAKNGSPPGDPCGTTAQYLCRSTAHAPSASQNPRLLPFAGEHVTVTGKDYARNGSHGLGYRHDLQVTPLRGCSSRFRVRHRLLQSFVEQVGQTSTSQGYAKFGICGGCV